MEWNKLRFVLLKRKIVKEYRHRTFPLLAFKLGWKRSDQWPGIESKTKYENQMSNVWFPPDRLLFLLLLIADAPLELLSRPPNILSLSKDFLIFKRFQLDLEPGWPAPSILGPILRSHPPLSWKKTSRRIQQWPPHQSLPFFLSWMPKLAEAPHLDSKLLLMTLRWLNDFSENIL